MGVDVWVKRESNTALLFVRVYVYLLRPSGRQWFKGVSFETCANSRSFMVMPNLRSKKNKSRSLGDTPIDSDI